MSGATLLLIDGHNVVRRVYEAITDAPSEAERVARAMRSSLQSIRRCLEENATSHALVVFDHGGKNWRHGHYAEYKANRPPTPPEFKAAISGLRERIEGVLGVHTLSKDGFEADDLIGAIVRKWIDSGKPAAAITVASTDKDLQWLIAFGVRIRDHFEKIFKTEEDVQRKFGVRPALVLDWLALVGDKTDNVPGLAGCGKVTATEWLNKYGSLSALLENADQIGGKIGEKLRAGMDMVRLSRLLVSLRTDMQCGVTWNQMRRQ